MASDLENCSICLEPFDPLTGVGSMCVSCAAEYRPKDGMDPAKRTPLPLCIWDCGTIVHRNITISHQAFCLKNPTEWQLHKNRCGCEFQKKVDYNDLGVRIHFGRPQQYGPSCVGKCTMICYIFALDILPAELLAQLNMYLLKVVKDTNYRYVEKWLTGPKAIMVEIITKRGIREQWAHFCRHYVQYDNTGYSNLCLHCHKQLLDHHDEAKLLFHLYAKRFQLKGGFHWDTFQEWWKSQDGASAMVREEERRSLMHYNYYGEHQ